ncbi:hypothetical protein [Tsukamurella sp. NPDC003166]|uniref:hypothetical protein n=1 Tax=Tsukamurella sp. NPDC003166 TaxID=3154444 RepID=UPI0033A2AF7D
MGSAIEVTVSAHWINSWFLRALTIPILTVDGTERALSWRQPFRLSVEPGQHRVAVGVRYRGFAAVLGQEPITAQVAAETTVRLRAKNGPLNSDPFRITAVGIDTE